MQSANTKSRNSKCIFTRFIAVRTILIQWYFITKIVLTYCEKKYYSNQEKILEFDTEGREFAKFLRSLEQFIQTVKG